jgi:hypothetical protein
MHFKVTVRGGEPEQVPPLQLKSLEDEGILIQLPLEK